MINEYLFLSDESRTTVEAYKPAGITVEISGIENTPLWVAAYSLASKNEDSAKKLSEVHTIIMQYAPLVLSCGSSGYYNRILFPLVNELERKLRKLLYLAASISDNDKAKENIKQLEEKDFGEIFDLLFIDQNFILDMKKRINAEAKSEFNGKSKYSKKEIESYLESLVEHALWDTILGEKEVPTLRIRFRDVQTYRNDVMHAHNISSEFYGKARYLFGKINKELDSSIGKLIGTSEDKTTGQKPEVNTAISSALAAMDLSAISETFRSTTALSGVTELSSQLSKVLQDLQPLKSSSAMADALKGVTMQPAITEALKGISPVAMDSALAEALKGIQSTTIQPGVEEALKAFQSLQTNNALVEAMRTATAFQTSPAVASLQQQLSLISDLMKPYRQMEQILQPYKALQDSLRSITEGLPRNLTLNDEPDEANEEELETNNEKPEEGNSNE